MKSRILVTLVALVAISSMALAGDRYTRDTSVLPTAAQTVLSKNFKAKVNMVKIDKELGRVKDYEVILTDGTEISFDHNGNWENVEVGLNGNIPAAFIPSGVSSYVKANMKGKKIVGIEKKRGGYEVELSDGVDMKFDSKGNFLRFD